VKSHKLQIIRLKIVCGWGSALDPAGGAYENGSPKATNVVLLVVVVVVLVGVVVIRFVIC